MSLSFCISEIHPEEDLGPILGFCATCSRMNGEDGVSSVVFFIKEGLQLGRLQVFSEQLKGFLQFVSGVFAFLDQLKKNLELFFFFL
jgi:hypothetical protein